MADALDIRWRGVIPSNHRSGVTGAEVEQGKDKEGHHHHDRDGGENTAEKVDIHSICPYSLARFQ
jgi:hypothetical protein